MGRFLLIISLLRAKNSSNLCSIWIITVRQQENETALKGGKRKTEITPSSSRVKKNYSLPLPRGGLGVGLNQKTLPPFISLN